MNACGYNPTVFLSLELVNEVAYALVGVDRGLDLVGNRCEPRDTNLLCF
jgi:hypothetical protein